MRTGKKVGRQEPPASEKHWGRQTSGRVAVNVKAVVRTKACCDK